MATDTEEILLKIKVENSAAVEEIIRLQDSVKALNEANKQLQERNKQLGKEMAELAKQGKGGSAAFKALADELQKNKAEILANSTAVKAYNKDISDNTKTLTDNITKTQAAEGSLKAMSKELSTLKKQYREMGEEERKSADGTALRDKIKALSDTLKEEEAAYGSTGRNVGNYEEAIRKAIEANGALNNSVIGNVKAIGQMSEQAGGLGNLLKGGLKTAINAVWSALKALMSNPIVALIAVVTAAVMGLIKVIKGNEEQVRKLQTAFAPVQAFLDWLVKILQTVADGLITVIGWVGKLVGGLSSALEKLPLVGDAIKDINEASREAVALEERKQALTDAQRDSLVTQAEREREIAALKIEAAKKDTYTAEERIKMTDRAIALELEGAAEKKRLKEEELAIMEEEAKRNNNSAEVNQKIAELKAEVIRMEAEGLQQTRRLESQRQTLLQQIASEQKAADDERLKRQQEYQKTVAAGAAQLEKLTLDLMAEGAEKEKAVREAAYKKELEQVQGTEKQKAEIRALLLEQYNRDLAAIEEKYSKEAMDRAVEQRANQLNAELELAREDADRKLAINLELLEQEKAAAIANAEETGVAVETIEALYAQRAADLEAQAEEERKNARAERLEELMQGVTDGFQDELDRAAENAQAVADTEVAIQSAKLEALRTLDEEQKAELFDSEEAYQEAVRAQIAATDAAQQKSTEEAKKARVAAIQDAQAKLDGIGDIAGGIADLFNTIAGDNETMQKFLKGVALFQITVDMAKAIAGAISGAMTQPFPANIAAIVSGIAAVTSGIVQAKQTLAQGKEEPAPKFATGGLVSGPGTGTSDSVPAMLSNGESVMTAAATAMFAPMLSAMNVAGGGVPISVGGTASAFDLDAAMAESVTKAFAAMPAPQVSVEEINTVDTRVEVMEVNRYV